MCKRISKDAQNSAIISQNGKQSKIKNGIKIGLRILFSILCSCLISFLIVYLINKNLSIQNCLFYVLTVLIFILTIGFNFIVNVYPKIIKNSNNLSLFIKRHDAEIMVLEAFVCFAIYCMANKKKVDAIDKKIPDIISVEWIILGITIAFFAIWSTIYSLQSKKEIKNPEKLVGKEREKEISYINLLRMEYKIKILPIIALSINVLLLALTTYFYYIGMVDVGITIFFLQLSFWSCLYALVIVLMEIIVPVILERKWLEKEVKNYNLDEGDELKNQSEKEEAMIQAAQKLAKALDLPNQDDVIEKTKQAIIDDRNKNECKNDPKDKKGNILKEDKTIEE